MPSVEANGITIEYEESGRGDPVLLVMGLAGQLIDWPDELIDILEASGFRVIRYDNRDTGLSSATDRKPPSQLSNLWALITRRGNKAAYTIDDMAADAVGLLDALEIERAHVFGISMGGMIGQAMAINHPTRVRSLTSVMSNTGDQKNGRTSIRVLLRLLTLYRKDPSPEEAAELATKAYSLFAGPTWDREEHLQHVRKAIERSYRPEGVAHQSAAIAASPDRTEGLGGVTAPTLVIHGLQDTLVKPSGGVATAEAVPGSRLLMFPDMGHDLPRPRMDEIVDAISDNAKRAVSA